MQRYFMWAGAVLIVVVILMQFVTGLYSEYRACEEFYDSVTSSVETLAPDSTSTDLTPTWIIAAHCGGVENNLYLSYYFIALGMAFLVGGFIVRG